MSSVEPFPFLVGFSGGNVCVSKMSFNITSMTPAGGLERPTATAQLTSLGATVLVTGNASATFDRVRFAAVATDDSDDYNVNHDIEITGRQQWLTPPTHERQLPPARPRTDRWRRQRHALFLHGIRGVMTDRAHGRQAHGRRQRRPTERL